MNEITPQFWKEYAPLYNKFTPSNQKELFEYIANFAKGVVFDVGTGVGKAIPYFLKNSQVTSIYGIDANSHMLDLAKENYSEKVTLKQLDLSQISNLEESFDSVYLTNVAYLLRNPLDFFSQVHRKLNEEGILVVSNPNRKIDFSQLEKVLCEEFQHDCDFMTYAKMNEILVNSIKNPPTLYHPEELISILDNLGFEYVTHRDDLYFGNLSSLVVKKK